MMRQGLAIALFVLLLGAGFASAQIIKNPNPLPFESQYVVMGRAVDKDGEPVSQALLTVAIDGLKGITVKPTQVQTDCFGDFGAFFDLGTLGGNPRVTVSIEGKDNGNVSAVSTAQDLNTQFRRNDVILRLKDPWPFECGHARDIWPHRVTVWGRVVRGVDFYKINNTQDLTAVPLNDTALDLEFKILPDRTTWRPDTVGPLMTDRLGDYQYSWIFQNDTDFGQAFLGVANHSLIGNFDNTTRVVFLDLNVGRDAPTKGFLPAPDAPAVLAAALLALLGVAAMRPARRPR
ncbi:MAG: hypothetical protein ACYDCK_05930 [Thermoplasmatota archaeon]